MRKQDYERIKALKRTGIWCPFHKVRGRRIRCLIHANEQMQADNDYTCKSCRHNKPRYGLRIVTQGKVDDLDIKMPPPIWQRKLYGRRVA